MSLLFLAISLTYCSKLKENPSSVCVTKLEETAPFTNEVSLSDSICSELPSVDVVLSIESTLDFNVENVTPDDEISRKYFGSSTVPML